MYTYAATVIRVVDGDTIDVLVDLGLDELRKLRLRLNRINAPETSTDAGKVARDWLKAFLPEGTSIVVKTIKDRREKYGRYLAEVILPGDICVNDLIVTEGHAQYKTY